MSHSLSLPSFPPVTWADLTAQRNYLVRFARHRLMDPALAVEVMAEGLGKLFPLLLGR